jgi:hypothetical protein
MALARFPWPEMVASSGILPARSNGNPWLDEMCGYWLSRARRVLAQERGQGGPKVYSLHAPEVECIGKGKAPKPCEFGVKVSVATNRYPVVHTWSYKLADVA